MKRCDKTHYTTQKVENTFLLPGKGGGGGQPLAVYQIISSLFSCMYFTTPPTFMLQSHQHSSSNERSAKLLNYVATT